MYQKQVTFELPVLDSKQHTSDRLDPTASKQARPVILSSEDLTKISKERNKLRLFTQLKKMGEKVNSSEFTSYYCQSPANTPPVAVTSHRRRASCYSDNKRSVTIYPTLVESPQFETDTEKKPHKQKSNNICECPPPSPDEVIVQEPGETSDNKDKCSCSSECSSISPQSKEYPSLASEDTSNYRDNIKRFSENSTMTSTVADASCSCVTRGAPVVSDAAQATAPAACCQTKSGKRVNIYDCCHKTKKNNKQQDKIKCKTSCQDECKSKSEDAVPEPSVTDDSCCEDTDERPPLLQYHCEKPGMRETLARDCRNSGQRMGRNRCDKGQSRHAPRRPRSTPRSGSPCCSTSTARTTSPNRPREPSSPRPVSRYHRNCINVIDMDAESGMWRRPRPVCAHNFAHCCGNKYFTESPIRSPRRVLTSERNIDAFIDRTRFCKHEC